MVPGTRQLPNLMPLGTHCDTITDAVGCVSVGCITIGEPPPITITITSTDPLCNGDCTGEATAAVTGGTPPYTYLWTGGSTDSTATNLCAGVYTVLVTDAAGCVQAGAAFIGEPTALTATISATDASCFGVCDGSVTVTPSGGSPFYTYLWSPSGGIGQNESGLCAGTHCVKIMDINGCTLDTCIAVNEPPAIVLATGSIDATCGDSNGVAYVTVTSGGVVPFTYQWDAQAGGQINDTATGLAAGAYTVVVTDVTGCKDSVTVSVNDVGSPSASIFAKSDANCFGVCDGYAQVNVTGGTPPYTYLWDDTGNSTTSSVSTLCAGFYTITVTDTNGCIAITSVTISGPDSITTTFTTVDEKCYLVCDGEATVHVTGGIPPYSYLWDAGALFQTDSTAAGLCGDGGTGTGGAFVVQITDTNGCIKTSEVSIVPALLLAIVNVNIVDPTCDSLGTATMSINGGYPPYSYLWIDNSTADTIEYTITVDSLSGGGYTAVVIDSNGCNATAIANVNDVQLPELSINSVINVSCFGDSTGIAIVVVDSGGTPPFTYEWFDGPGSPIGQTDSIATGLAAGTYTVEVTDSNNCTASIDTTITEPPPLTTAIIS
ncbi:MAG: SprB repeat-containing protein [Bacteroidetes bacterium]|nr:SprB repeat-containing protein [Bacteroidota bacterium]